MIKKIGFSVLVVALLLCIWQWELLVYGIGQGYGQFRILYNARPLEEMLNDREFPDSLKARLHLIQEIRRYAIDSLGINESNSYTTVFDQRGKPILWTITASEPYQLKAKQWSFPFFGSFSYKGFFDYQKCLREEAELKKQGFDTEIGEVSAWSTLGWFNDPILSSMLSLSEGGLANLIIHELTHGTLYVKNNVEYNENLASFVGDYGALRFLIYKYGKDSFQYRKYEARKKYRDKYYRHVLRGAKQLESLYATFTNNTPKSNKDQLKTSLIKEIIGTIDTLTPRLGKNVSKTDTILPNNAFFIGYQTYHNRQNKFEVEFKTKFNSNFKEYLSYLKKTYPSL